MHFLNKGRSSEGALSRTLAIGVAIQMFLSLTVFCFALPAQAQQKQEALQSMVSTTPVGKDDNTSAELLDEIADRLDDTSQLKEAYESLVNNPISPPDTRSPRATLASFLLIMQAAEKLWVSTRDAYFATNDIRLTPQQRRNVELVEALLEKASQTMDLEGIAVASRDRSTIELTLQLQEIFDRIYLPDLADIPGVGAGAVGGDDTALPDRWIVPGTNLTIARQESGPRTGEFLFTKATVDRIPDDYETIEALPFTNDRGEDLYAYYIYTPGNLIAPQWYGYILDGPEWLKKRLSGQTYWQWIAMLISLVILVICVVFYARWNARRAVPLNAVRRQLRRIVHPILLLIVANLFIDFCTDQVNITGELLLYLTTATSIVIWSTSSWLVYQVLQLIYLWTTHNPAVNKSSLDASLLRTGFRVVALAISIVVLGYGATRIGIPIYGVVAGLGVGGLAIALAAQPTLENFIGGLILYADRIVRVGDFFQFGDIAGTVEEIGIRSTRIRALDRTLIIVSNADLAKSKITNYSQRDVFLFRHKIGLRYETGAATLSAVTRRYQAAAGGKRERS